MSTPILTIHISTMIQHRIETGSVPRVPYADTVVPAAGDDDVGDLSVPHQAADRSRVAGQYYSVPLLCVVPHVDRAKIHYILLGKNLHEKYFAKTNPRKYHRFEMMNILGFFTSAKIFPTCGFSTGMGSNWESMQQDGMRSVACKNSLCEKT